jgi:hypothetical protein
MADSKRRRLLRGHAMIPAYIYDHGTKAYNEGVPLSGNPFNPASSAAAHEAWRDGWLDASRARARRLRALEIAARAIC